MSFAQQTREIVKKFENSKLFTYDDFPIKNKSAVAIELSRLYKQGIIKKVSKGKYYRPKTTSFGEIKPTFDEIVKSYMDKDSYETGINAYRKLGLTTQLSNSITIATNRPYKKVKLDNIVINFVPKRVKAPKEDNALLVVLDALKDIKKIPDSTPSEVIMTTKKIMFSWDKKRQKKLITYATFYPPRVIAIVGAIFMEFGYKDTQTLKELLNPLTKFKLNLKDDVLIYQKEWGIV